MTIVEARNILSARRWAREEYGRLMEPRVSIATEDDVEWYKMMGGCLHKVYS